MNEVVRSAALVVAFLCFVVGGCSAMPNKDIFESREDDERAWTALERSAVTSAQVNWANASAPLGKYLLISDGDFLCAIRFVNFRRGQDARPGSIWSSGEETLTSAYEWKVLDREGINVKVSDQGRGTVRFTAPWGFGHLVIGGGYENVRCGSREFGWQYPAGINFSQAPGSDRKLAPTRWSEVKDIKLNDPKLLWYSFDQKREPMNIPLRDL